MNEYNSTSGSSLCILLSPLDPVISGIVGRNCYKYAIEIPVGKQHIIIRHFSNKIIIQNKPNCVEIYLNFYELIQSEVERILSSSAKSIHSQTSKVSNWSLALTYNMSS
jgi:hypothetical protein